MITAKIHNSALDIVSTLAQKKTGQPKSIQDYMPKYKDNRKKTWQEIKAITEAWAASLKGR